VDLSAPGAILLVSCYELGHQPLGVAWPMAFLENAGYAPDALDIAVDPFDVARVARARMVAISVPMHTALRLGVRVAERVRAANPSCHICFYGLYAALNGPYLLAHGADSIVGGEYEGALVRLVQALAAGDPQDVVGVGRADRPAPPPLERLPFPVPSRAALPRLDRYAQLEEADGHRRAVGYVEASRGCLHTCRHCPIPPVYGGRFFVVPRDVVLADIRRLVRAGSTHITFGDPDFLNGPLHSLRIAEAMHDEFPAVTFDVTTKVEHVIERRALFPRLQELGCLFVVSAFESVSDVVLAELGKGHTRADEVVALAVVRDAGMTLRPTWVAFTPWTTLDDYNDMLQFVAEHRLVDAVDPVQYAVRLLIPPGSALLQRPSIGAVLGDLDAPALSYRWTHPDSRMDDLAHAVGALVEASADQDPATTFAGVRRLAHAAAGHPVDAETAPPPPGRPLPPRLTEPWFC